MSVRETYISGFQTVPQVHCNTFECPENRGTTKTPPYFIPSLVIPQVISLRFVNLGIRIHLARYKIAYMQLVQLNSETEVHVHMYIKDFPL